MRAKGQEEGGSRSPVGKKVELSPNQVKFYYSQLSLNSIITKVQKSHQDISRPPCLTLIRCDSNTLRVSHPIRLSAPPPQLGLGKGCAPKESRRLFRLDQRLDRGVRILDKPTAGGRMVNACKSPALSRVASCKRCSHRKITKAILPLSTVEQNRRSGQKQMLSHIWA